MSKLKVLIHYSNEQTCLKKIEGFWAFPKGYQYHAVTL